MQRELLMKKLKECIKKGADSNGLCVIQFNGSNCSLRSTCKVEKCILYDDNSFEADTEESSILLSLNQKTAFFDDFDNEFVFGGDNIEFSICFV